MSFVSWTFPVFLTVVLLVYWLLPGRRWQNGWLLLASLVCYGWVHPWFLALVGFSTVLDYSLALGMGRFPAHRRLLLGLSVAGNLGLLGAFKYLDFFLANLQALGLGGGTLGILLPVGISFFTFQTLSYTIDVYRGRISARRDFLDYATFVCMFPQLAAGPIERARDLLPQVEQRRTWDGQRVLSGLTLMLWGAVKKLVVADTLGLYVDRVYALDEPGGWLIYAATLGFAVQILADFSGYTDMARGMARMMGFELRQNFDAPYAAASPSEFWRRWHISLSSWIHDYLYIPLGGNRSGPARTVAATLGAMLLSGLWHGASWHFVVWGAYHAALLLIWRGGRSLVPERLRARREARWLGVALMFPLTCVGWLIFREPDLNDLLQHLTRNPLGGTWFEQVVASVVVTLSLAGAAFLLLGGLAGRAFRSRRTGPWSLPVHTTLWAAALVLLALFARDSSRDFIYFQF